MEIKPCRKCGNYPGIHTEKLSEYCYTAEINCFGVMGFSVHYSYKAMAENEQKAIMEVVEKWNEAQMPPEFKALNELKERFQVEK